VVLLFWQPPSEASAKLQEGLSKEVVLTGCPLLLKLYERVHVGIAGVDYSPYEG
jgi:hypothetical protein